MHKTSCEQLNDLIKEFFEFEDPTALSENLSTLLENYIANVPVQKTDLANVSYVVTRLITFLHSLERLQNIEADGATVLIDGEKQKCLHN